MRRDLSDGPRLLREDAVLNAPKLREGTGGARRVRDELEAVGVGPRPRHRGRVHHLFTCGAGGGNASPAGYGAAPMNVEAAPGRGGWCEVKQRVGDAAEVGHGEVGRGHPCAARAELDVAHWRNWERPEESTRVGVDSGIEIVHLGREIREVILTSVEVQSNEAEHTLVHGSVETDIDAAHETHVSVEKQCLGAPIGVGGRPGALHVGNTDETVEVGDR